MKTVFFLFLLGICSPSLSTFSFYSEKINDNEKILLERERGGTRSGTNTEIEAILNDYLLFIHAMNYSGMLWVDVIGDDGSLQQSSHIEHDSQILLDISPLPQGNYLLRITLENAVYSGYFEY